MPRIWVKWPWVLPLIVLVFLATIVVLSRPLFFTKQGRWPQIQKFYGHVWSRPRATYLPAVPEHLPALAQKAQRFFEQGQDAKLKHTLIMELAAGTLYFPFLHWIEGRPALRQDPEVALFLKNLWAKAAPIHPDFWPLFAHISQNDSEAEFEQKFYQLLQRDTARAPSLSWLALTLQKRGSVMKARQLYQLEWDQYGAQAPSALDYLEFLSMQKDHAALEEISRALSAAKPDLATQIQSITDGASVRAEGVGI